jgi:hypothetical protein
MKDTYATATTVGMAGHYTFSTVTMRDACGKVERRLPRGSSRQVNSWAGLSPPPVRGGRLSCVPGRAH